jgi:hypothetical protein
VTLVTGQPAVTSADGLTATIDSDNTTGQISAITVANNAPRAVSFWYSRNGVTQTRSVPAGTNVTFNPPTAGVKWLTDAISWGVG